MPSFDRCDNLRSEETKWFGQGGKSQQKQSRHWNLPPHALCQNQEFRALWALQGLLKTHEIDRPQLFRLSPDGGRSKQMKNLWVCVWRGYPKEGTGGHQSTGFPRPALPEVKAKVSQLCPTLRHPMDCTVHGILQARILEWVAVPFSRGSSQPRDRTQVSHIAGRFFTSRATREAQEYWSG